MPAPRELSNGWIPAFGKLAGDDSTLKWLDGRIPYDEKPFYRDTMAGLAEKSKAIETPFEAVHEVAHGLTDAIPPTAFIFHMSRCGSTLVQNALRCIEGAFVPGEPQPLSFPFKPYAPELWPGPREGWEKRRDGLLVDLMKIFGRHGARKDRHLIVKTTSWNVLGLDLMRRLFPRVPWLYIYREPVEVVASNVKEPQMWMSFSPLELERLFGWKASEICLLPKEVFSARVVGRFCEVAAKSDDAKAHFLNYEDIDLDRMVKIAELLVGRKPTAPERDRMAKSMRIYSKDPAQTKTFASDSAAKRDGANPLLQSAAAEWVEPWYRKLNESPRRVR